MEVVATEEGGLETMTEGAGRRNSSDATTTGNCKTLSIMKFCRLLLFRSAAVGELVVCGVCMFFLDRSYHERISLIDGFLLVKHF